MKIFKCVFVNKGDITTELIPTDTKKEVKESYSGNGKIVLIKDITDAYYLDTYELNRILEDSDYTKKDQSLILRIVKKVLNI